MLSQDQLERQAPSGTQGLTHEKAEDLEAEARVEGGVCGGGFELIRQNAMPGAAVIDSQSVKGGQLPAVS